MRVGSPTFSDIKEVLNAIRGCYHPAACFYPVGEVPRINVPRHFNPNIGRSAGFYEDQ